ncbi:hypothetical protein BGX24_005649, partial [Mortierella sp. AD032]
MDTETDVDSDTELLLESGVVGGRSARMNPDITLHSVNTTPVASENTTPAQTPISTERGTATSAAAASSSSHLPLPLDDLEGAMAAADLYRSTIEFLALMTAFVSVVCWLMQTRLLDTGSSTRDQGGPESSAAAAAAMEGVNIEHDGFDSVHRDGCAQLREFLSHFDDLDNVLNPIKEALSRTSNPHQRRRYGDEQQESDAGLDPMDSVGLFAWHYVLFASDQEGPFEREAHAIDLPSLHSVHFDVILNELYTTHILSMTAKEHQKDHGQFYTPPGVVDFMWKRTILDRGRLLDQFVESMSSSIPPYRAQQDLQEPLIPTALDPCLGVSTFLSCYVRLLIQEAERDHNETIWKSEAACRLLLSQICTHVWGIELDGFAFWMARDTLQLTVPDGTSPKTVWDRHCILQLRNPSRLQFDFIVTNPPYMIRKTGTFSAPDPEVYDWSILGANIATASAAFSANAASATTVPEGSSSTPKGKSRSAATKAFKVAFEEEEGGLTPTTVDTGEDDSGSEATMTMTPSGERLSKSGGGGSEPALLQSSPRTKKIATQVRPTGSKGMMQAYGYFVWFAAQRIKPGKGVVCMITASQWLTLEFAVKLRAWLFENCLMDEFFQFEPYKVFSKVQTDSLIFKIRAIPPDLLPSSTSTTATSSCSSPPHMSSSSSSSSILLPLGDHRTVFLRHTDHHKPLVGILQDYMAYSSPSEDLKGSSEEKSPFVVVTTVNNSSKSNSNDSNIMVSSKTREELAAIIMAPTATANTSSSTTTTATTTAAAGTGIKGEEAPAAPVATYTYSFAPMMPASVLTTYMLALTQDLGAICKALHREGQFWQGRDRQRLRKKEGSPAESYCVPTSDPQR